MASVGRFKYNKKLDVLSRALNTYLATDLFDENGEVLFEKNTFLNRETLNALSKVRHILLKEVISKENNIENEIDEEILASYSPDGGDALYAKENIKDAKTQEILIRKNEEITPEKINLLREHRASLAERVVRYFLTEDVYKKEANKRGVLVEVLDVYTSEENMAKDKSLRLIGNNQRDRKSVV